MKDKCSKTNKTIFSDLGSAQDAILGLKAQHWDNVTKRRRKRRCKKAAQKRAYYCTHCEGYHLTSQETYSETIIKYEKRAKSYTRIPQSIWNRRRISS